MANPEDVTPEKNKLFNWKVIVGILLILVIIGQFSGGTKSNNSNTSSTSTPTSSSSKSVDIMTKKSCRDWYSVISEGAKGIQTDAELRAGMRKVYDTARYSEDLDISDAATRQLAAVTAGDTSAFETAAIDFGNACKAHGQ